MFRAPGNAPREDCDHQSRLVLWCSLGIRGCGCYEECFPLAEPHGTVLALSHGDASTSCRKHAFATFHVKMTDDDQLPSSLHLQKKPFGDDGPTFDDGEQKTCGILGAVIFVALASAGFETAIANARYQCL
mmetsp:Transcript_22168/g.44475  ORF Transcript_22168/g.44475 Transcript_22168/m.44475 type:complete len:131 (-) Transcript_22168:147-539(-)